MVYFFDEDKYVKIMDVMPKERCYVYPSYESSVVASGKEVDLFGQIKSNKVYWVTHGGDGTDHALIQKEDLLIFHIQRRAEMSFYNALRKGILKKVKTDYVRDCLLREDGEKKGCCLKSKNRE